MYEYKQRPWSRKVSDEEYNRAVGRPAPRETCAPSAPPEIQRAEEAAVCEICGVSGEHFHIPTRTGRA